MESFLNNYSAALLKQLTIFMILRRYIPFTWIMTTSNAIYANILTKVVL